MHKTMSLWLFLALFVCLLGGIFCFGGKLSAALDDVSSINEEGTVRLAEAQGKNAELEAMLETVGTDTFIENQARTLYGYMMPDEIRFVITNPEVLYGDEELPSD